jgi:hypothetical protein
MYGIKTLKTLRKYTLLRRFHVVSEDEELTKNGGAGKATRL